MWHDNHRQLYQECQDIPVPPKPKLHPARLSELISIAPQSIFPVKQCQECLTIWNRDINAARNIRRVGLLMFTGQPRHLFFGPAPPG